jgi:nicotinamidase-related amidase
MVRGLDRGERAALVISECQNGIANIAYSRSPLSEQVSTRNVVPKINLLASHFRSANLPVIHCTITARPDFSGWKVNCVLAARIQHEGKLVKGTVFGAIHDAIELVASDIIVERHHGMSPFTGTALDATLRGFGIDTVVFAGVSTNIALPSGSAEAVALGYSVVLAEDCCAGGTVDTHQTQITMHLPLIATISDGTAIADAIDLKQTSTALV